MRAKAAISVCVTALLLGVCTRQLLLAQAAPGVAGSAGPAARFQDSTNDLTVGVGKTVLVDTAQPIARVAVGLGDIAVASAVSPTEIMINGKAPGETSLIIWDIHGGRQFFNVRVRPSTAEMNSGLEAIRRELRTELPDQQVHVTIENGNVFLRGTVKDLNSSERAVKIASVGGKVVNLLSVRVPDSEPQSCSKCASPAWIARSKSNWESTSSATVLGMWTALFQPASSILRLLARGDRLLFPAT